MYHSDDEDDDNYDVFDDVAFNRMNQLEGKERAIFIARERESIRIRSIKAMGDQYGYQEIAKSLIDRGASVQEARSVISRKLDEDNDQKPLGQLTPMFGDERRILDRQNNNDWQPLLKHAKYH